MGRKNRERAKREEEANPTSPGAALPAQKPALLPRLDGWLGAHRRGVLLALTLAAVLVRVVYMVQLTHSPCIRQHLWAETDMNFFDVWGRRIAGGDWLTDPALHPQHSWHKDVADAYVATQPSADAALAAQGIARAPGATGPADVTALLWDRWFGGNRFHQEPLYPYLLGVTYRLFGTEVRWVFCWQMLLGIGSVLLIAGIARRLFGNTTGALAGILAVGCSPLLFYELILLREVLISFLGLAVVFLTLQARDHGTWWRWGAVGLVIGLAVLTKGLFLLLAVGTVLAVLVVDRPTRRAFCRTALALAAGVALALAPVVARNVAERVPALALSSVNEVSFILGNASYYSPQWGNWMDAGVIADILGRTQGRLLPTIAAALATHGSVTSVLRQSGEKLAWAWNWYERPNNECLYVYRLWAPILSWLPLTFAVLGPLGLAGLFLAFPRLRQAWPLYLLVGLHLGTLLISLVLSRYRLPMLAALIPFAAWTPVRAWEWLASERWAWLAATLALLVAAFAVTLRPLPPGLQAVPSHHHYALLGYYESHGGREAAREYLRAALRVAPGEPEVLFRLGRLHEADNGRAEALACYEQVPLGYPSGRAALFQASYIHRAEGRLAEATKGYERLIRFDAANPAPVINLLSLFADSKDAVHGPPLADQAVRTFPSHPTVQANAAAVFRMAGQLDKATAAQARAQALQKK